MTTTDTTTTDTPATPTDTPDAPTDAATPSQRLWAALLQRPESTATELATAAGTGASTARKLLTAWNEAGHAHHTPGKTARAAHQWSATPPSTDTPTNTPTDTPTDTTTDTEETTTANDPSDDTADHGHVAVEVAGEPDGDGGDDDGAGDGVGVEGETRAPGLNRSGTERLGAGALKGMIEDYLSEHVGQHTPSTIATALGRSSGAVANACERLVEEDVIVRACEAPRRYRHGEHDPSTDPVITPRRSPSTTIGSRAARRRPKTNPVITDPDWWPEVTIDPDTVRQWLNQPHPDDHDGDGGREAVGPARGERYRARGSGISPDSFEALCEDASAAGLLAGPRVRVALHLDRDRTDPATVQGWHTITEIAPHRAVPDGSTDSETTGGDGAHDSTDGDTDGERAPGETGDHLRLAGTWAPTSMLWDPDHDPHDLDAFVAVLDHIAHDVEDVLTRTRALIVRPRTRRSSTTTP